MVGCLGILKMQIYIGSVTSSPSQFGFMIGLLLRKNFVLFAKVFIVMFRGVKNLELEGSAP